MNALLAQSATRTYYHFARLDALTEWWHWLLLVGACLLLVAYVAYVYWHDSVELRRGVAASLLVLRVAVLAVLLLYFLQLEKRSEQKVVRDSRLLVLVDTSQSMGLRDGQPGQSGGGPSRQERVVAAFMQGALLPELRKKHEVMVYRFDQQNQPTAVAAFAKLRSTTEGDATTETAASDDAFQFNRLLQITGGLALAAVLLALVHAFVGGRALADEAGSWALLGCILMGIFAVITAGVAHLRFPNECWFAAAKDESETASPTNNNGSAPAADPVVDWNQELAARGVETRLGEAIRHLVNTERGGPVAGIVVFSDGNSNEGIAPALAMQTAAGAGIPLYCVGLGSDQRPKNVRVVDLEAPQRVYPGDPFQITGFVQAAGYGAQTVKVELASAAAAKGEVPAAFQFEEEQRIDLAADGTVASVKFTLSPKEVGQRVYRLKVAALADDHEPKDNERAANVQIVERKSKVLLMAGGPSREFQFLRNQLYRDKYTTVEVLLQSGKPGLSQESHDLLFEFPKTAEDLFEYDCIVAFDVDWQTLDLVQVDLLERFVAEKAGGLILVAGPVYTSQWSGMRRGEERIDKIKALYPVVFYASASPTMKLGRYGSEQAWPLQITREGEEADFLRLADDPAANDEAWALFEGVYGYFPIKDLKPGATVYARFSDPASALDDQLPVYFASQFYGAGRVFYMASGEMWRLRGADEKYFEQFYTKLLRWVTQGRLLRDSTRGVLLVDKERCLIGDMVSVRASLNDTQHQPLTDPEVTATLVQPGGLRTPLVLRKVKDLAREGMYQGQFNAALEGDHRIELRLPRSDDDTLLTREVGVRVPKREIERPERNDAVLAELAKGSAGAYFVGLETAISNDPTQGLLGIISPQDQETYLNGAPDRAFEQQYMGWLIGLLCGVLCCEWLIRRLNRLA